MIVVDGLKNRVPDDALVCVWDVREGPSNDSDQNGIVCSGGDDVLFCSL